MRSIRNAVPVYLLVDRSGGYFSLKNQAESMDIPNFT